MILRDYKGPLFTHLGVDEARAEPEGGGHVHPPVGPCAVEVTVHLCTHTRKKKKKKKKHARTHAHEHKQS